MSMLFVQSTGLHSRNLTGWPDTVKHLRGAISCTHRCSWFGMGLYGVETIQDQSGVFQIVLKYQKMRMSSNTSPSLVHHPFQLTQGFSTSDLHLPILHCVRLASTSLLSVTQTPTPPNTTQLEPQRRCRSFAVVLDQPLIVDRPQHHHLAHRETSLRALLHIWSKIFRERERGGAWL